MSKKDIQERIDRIKRDVANLGPLRPGTLYTRYSVCGKPGCRCVRKKKPIKHGPYHYLSYTFKGRSYTEFVPKAQLKKVKEEVNNYHKLMRSINSLIENSIKLARLQKPKS